MNALLERMEEQAVDLSQYSPVAEGGWEAYRDMLDDLRIGRRIRENMLRSREARIKGFGLPTMANGPFRQMVDGSVIVDANQAQITGTAETGLFPVAQYTSLGASTLRPGTVWQLTTFGIATTPSSAQGNITITPRYGTSTGGTSLGASPATALAASATNVLWQIEMVFEIRAIGLAGTNSHAVAGGIFSSNVALIAAATGNTILFGSTGAVSIDATIAAGLFIGMTLGSASDTMTCLGHPMLESIN